MERSEENFKTDAFMDRVAAYQDGRLPDQDIQTLRDELKTDAKKRRLFYDMFIQSQLIRELFKRAETRIDLTQDELPCEAARPLFFQLLPKVWPAAAAILLAMLSYQVLHEAPPARITYSSAVRWVQGSPSCETGDAISNRTYAMKRGMLRLEMRDETVVTLQAPARFRIRDANTFHLQEGKVSVRVSDPDSKFTVRTKNMDVIDLGTAFGVHVKPEGDAQVSVFEGAVLVQDRTETRAERLLLERRAAIQTDSIGQILARIDFDPELYRELWPLTNRVDEVSDLVTFIPPGVEGRLEDFQSNDGVYLLAEKQHMRLEKSLRLDISAENKRIQLGKKFRPGIEAGKQVNSFLVFFNSIKPGTWRKAKHIEGTIRFEKQVLGIIGSRLLLDKSDPLFTIPAIQYSQDKGRGLKLRKSNNVHVPMDTVMIGADRREIHFKLNSGPGMDQFRVLVEG